MKKMIKKLWLSFAAVAFAVIAVGTTTYAWFSTSSKAQVTNFDLNVQTAGGIQISTNATAWSTVIDSLTTPAGTLTALTAAWVTDKYEMYGINQITGEVLSADSDGVTPGNQSDLSNNLLTVTLYVRNVGTDATDIYLSSNSEATAKVTIALQNPDGGTTSYTVNPANALRYYISTAENLADATAATGATPVAKQNTVKENLVTGANADAIKTAIISSAQQFAADDDSTTVNTVNTALAYCHNLRKAVTEYRAAWTGDAEDEEDKINGSAIASIVSTTKTKIATGLTSGKIAKVKLSFWVEGWDPTCFDAILDQVISTALFFDTSGV